MARTDFDVQVAGLKELVEGFRTMADPRAQKQIIGASLTKTGRQVIIPAIKRQMAADFKKKGSHQNPRGVQSGRGQGGPAERNVTAKRVRVRSGELLAIGFGPRAWWSHLPIGGTKPHSLAAKRAGRSQYSVLPFASNAAAGRSARKAMGFRLSTADGGSSALRGIRLSGGAGQSSRRGSVRSNAGIWNPGTKGTDSISKAVQGVAGTLNERYVRDLQAAYDKHIAGPTRKAKPKAP